MYSSSKLESEAHMSLSIKEALECETGLESLYFWKPWDHPMLKSLAQLRLQNQGFSSLSNQKIQVFGQLSAGETSLRHFFLHSEAQVKLHGRRWQKKNWWIFRIYFPKTFFKVTKMFFGIKNCEKMNFFSTKKLQVAFFVCMKNCTVVIICNKREKKFKMRFWMAAVLAFRKKVLLVWKEGCPNKNSPRKI